MRLLLPSALALLAACSSSDDDPACGSLAGTYAQTEVIDADDPGSCGPNGSSLPTTFTVTDHGDGTAEITVERRTNPCPATLDGCTLTAQCPWLERGGGTVGDVHLALSFTASGATGTSVYTLMKPGGQSGIQCRGNFLVTATRQ